jgi:replication factor C subunit 3/5
MLTSSTVAVNNNLPWIEKYRPKDFGELILSEEKQKVLLKFFSKKSFPNLLFFGPPGVGKTSTILTCARKLYGEDVKLMVLELNASDERGIDVVRNKIKEFTTTQLGIVSSVERDVPKLIILDEVDSISSNAQSALLIEMEKRMKNARFCLICNYVHKLSTAIQSRCMKFKFSPLSMDQIKDRIEMVIENEQINITDRATNALIKISNGDLRKTINILQQISVNYLDEKISEESVYKITGHPLPHEIEHIFVTLISPKNIKEKYEILSEFLRQEGLDLYEVLKCLHKTMLKNLEMIQNIKFFDQLGVLEESLCKGADQEIQLSILVAVFHNNL